MRGNFLTSIIIFMIIAIMSYGIFSVVYKTDVLVVTFDDRDAEYQLIGDVSVSKKESFSKTLRFRGEEIRDGQMKCSLEYGSFSTPDTLYVKPPRVMKEAELESVTVDFETGTVKNAQGQDWFTIDHIEQMPSTTDVTFTVLNGELPCKAQLYVDDELRAECNAEYVPDEDGAMNSGVYRFASWPQMERTVTVKFLSKFVDVAPDEMSYSVEGKNVIEVK